MTTGDNSRGKYHKITTGEIELITKSKNAKEYLKKFKSIYPDTPRSDSAIKSIFNNRGKFNVKPELEKPQKQLTKVPVKQRKIIEVEEDPHQFSKPGKQVTDFEKQLVVKSKTFDEFFKQYLLLNPTTERETQNLYSMYGKRYLYKKDFDIITKRIASKTVPATPQMEDKDTEYVLKEMKNMIAELIQIAKDQLQVSKDTMELFKDLKKK